MLRVGPGRRTILNRGLGDIGYVAALKPAAWFRYGIGLTDDGGGLCSNWADQSGNGRNLTATLTARPTIQADKSLLFDGVANFMATGSFTLNQPCTYYFLGKQVTWTSADQIMSGFAGSAFVSQANVTPTLRMNAGSGVADNTNLAVNTYGVVAAVFNGASSLMQINNTAQTTGNAGAGNPTGFTLGASATGASAWGNIQAKEVIVFPSAHDSNTIARVMRYLAIVGVISI